MILPHVKLLKLHKILGTVLYSLSDKKLCDADSVKSGFKKVSIEVAWCRLTWLTVAPYAALQCPRNKMDLPLSCESALFPGEQTVSAFVVGACVDGGSGGQVTGNGNGKERAMMLVQAVFQIRS